MNTHIYLGIRIDIWNGQRAWFWRVVDSGHDAAVVGAATKETEAIRDACNSIEEMYGVRRETGEE
jgi:hypothetical protein